MPYSLSEQEAILLCQEKARGNCVHPYLKTVFLCHVNCQPLREIDNGGFGRTIEGYASQRTLRIHRGDIHYTAMSTLGHFAPKDLATLEGSGKIQTENAIRGFRVQVKEGLFG